MSLGHRIALVESTVVHDLSEAQALFKRLLSEGQEGIILKSLNGIWENKRAKHQIKFKGVFDCDLRIVGWEAGTGKNAGRLGALPLESEDGLIKVSVGTGFSDRQRDTITKEMIGQICALEFNGIVQDVRTGVYSLFLPSFKEIRFDKNRADTFEEIKAACNPSLKKD